MLSSLSPLLGHWKHFIICRAWRESPQATSARAWWECTMHIPHQYLQSIFSGMVVVPTHICVWPAALCYIHHIIRLAIHWTMTFFWSAPAAPFECVGRKNVVSNFMDVSNIVGGHGWPLIDHNLFWNVFGFRNYHLALLRAIPHLAPRQSSPTTSSSSTNKWLRRHQRARFFSTWHSFVVVLFDAHFTMVTPVTCRANKHPSNVNGKHPSKPIR